MRLISLEALQATYKTADNALNLVKASLNVGPCFSYTFILQAKETASLAKFRAAIY